MCSCRRVSELGNGVPLGTLKTRLSREISRSLIEVPCGRAHGHAIRSLEEISQRGSNTTVMELEVIGVEAKGCLFGLVTKRDCLTGLDAEKFAGKGAEAAKDLLFRHLGKKKEERREKEDETEAQEK